ncbi:MULTISPECIES: DoxX family protein [unclassified Bacillus (in: firmicutes)]|uniref:DoxX family protein n=1 Tax=unclassified Bacillus (in: firmicutes) TaxID=185979 RepID=UPI0027DFC93F|nr:MULTISPECIES: DoxX family protein [unclassified Bacillus (in: firmicutes)]
MKIYKGGIFILYPNKLIRITVAYVFITSALMKLMSTEVANHFLGLGLPYSHMMLKIIILLEIVCGILLLVNKAVKNAVVPLIGIMIAAILLTKVPLLHTGFLPFAFGARLDIVMLVLLVYLYKQYHS